MRTSEYQIELVLPIPEEQDEGDVTCTVTYRHGWFRRGNRSGHPDNWTPDEGEDAEILKVIREDTGQDVLGSLSAYNMRLVAERAREIDEAPYERE